MKIGSIDLKNQTVLAPLAGITNLPFRLIIKEHGCALVYSEMISSNGLVYQSGKTVQMLQSAAEEKPLTVQLFGSDASILAEAARIVEASGADILDINFGCSVKKVLKTGSGSALMKDPQKAEVLLKAVRNAISIPLTIKIRSGWDTSGKEALTIAKLAQDCGVDALAVHPRTARQGFSGFADWSVIAAVKKAVSLPVIGNGDITSPQDAKKMLDQTGCDAVMIGRACMKSPAIFANTIRYLNGEPIAPLSLTHHFEMMTRYLEASVRYIGEVHACRMMRSRLTWFVKGLPHNAKFKEEIKHISTEQDAKYHIGRYLQELKLVENRLPEMVVI